MGSIHAQTAAKNKNGAREGRPRKCQPSCELFVSRRLIDRVDVLGGISGGNGMSRYRMDYKTIVKSMASTYASYGLVDRYAANRLRIGSGVSFRKHHPKHRAGAG